VAQLIEWRDEYRIAGYIIEPTLVFVRLEHRYQRSSNDENSSHISRISTRGELSGRVTEGPPDRRTDDDRQQAAMNQILAISREFAEACER
jgi:hypothetical protein